MNTVTIPAESVTVLFGDAVPTAEPVDLLELPSATGGAAPSSSLVAGIEFPHPEQHNTTVTLTLLDLVGNRAQVLTAEGTVLAVETLGALLGLQLSYQSLVVEI